MIVHFNNGHMSSITTKSKYKEIRFITHVYHFLNSKVLIKAKILSDEINKEQRE